MATAVNFHTIEALRKKCRRKIPNVAFEYLESGTEKENTLNINQSQFESIKFIPKFCLGKNPPDLKTTFLNQEFSSPIGIAPVGLTGLIWPNAEKYLLKIADKNEIPFCLSTVATCSPEDVDSQKKYSSRSKWFQLYPPKDLDILDSLLSRAKNSGFSNLIVTVDIPAPSRRERSKHAGLNMPLKFSTRLIIDALLHPKWTFSTIKNGLPRLKTIESYTNNNSLKFVSKFVGNRLGGVIDWSYIELIRSKWDGPLILKGILHPDDALRAKQVGCDAVYVSNHGARQFDGGVSPLKLLMKIRDTVGLNYSLIYDSGIRSGLDIMKAIYAGADFVFVGRPFMYGVGAFQEAGAQQVHNILEDQLRNNMMQMGLENIKELKCLTEHQVELSFKQS
ncbi:alpha-hydroxy-acid oxidizing protein [Schleiferiaceae bacterium]|nr:alpha-hydroxy-acid oxidizing protein [Schleiferiaceae bacterium]